MLVKFWHLPRNNGLGLGLKHLASTRAQPSCLDLVKCVQKPKRKNYYVCLARLWFAYLYALCSLVFSVCKQVLPQLKVFSQSGLIVGRQSKHVQCCAGTASVFKL